MADAQGGQPSRGGRAPPPAPRPRRSILGALAYWTVVACVWVAIGVIAFFAVFAFDLPDTSKIFDVKRQPSIAYLDRSGAEIAVRGSQFSPPVDIDQLPPYVPAAFVSIEDRRFYQHWGFDSIGMARAVLADVRAGHAEQGASTITQQLARNLFLTPDQTIRRKAQELVLAVWLETQVHQEADPGALPEPGLFRRRRLWHRGRLAALLQQAGQSADRRRGGAAGRPDEGSLPLQPGLGHRPRRAPRHHRAGQDGRDRRDHRRPARRGVQRAGAGLDDHAEPERPVLRRLARPAGARAGGAARAGPGGGDHARPADPGGGGARRARRRRRLDVRTTASSRRRWWRWTARAASAPTSAASTTPEPVRPREPGPAPGRLVVQAVRLPDRHGGRPHAAGDDGRRADHDRQLDAAATSSRLPRADHAGDGAGAVDQHGRRAPRQRGRAPPTSPRPPIAWASPRRSRPIPRWRWARSR